MALYTIDETAEPSKTSVAKVETPSAPVKKTPPNIKSKKATSAVTVSKVANVTLTQDHFGVYYDHDDKQFKVERFTWRNTNNVQVQVITYGARIISVRTPDSRGIVDDIVLGCKDLAGYLYYGDLFLGAVIGRVTNKIKGGSFQIEGKQFKVNCNVAGLDYMNGGFFGLDKTIWKSNVNGSKVILSCISPDNHEGFPGDLFVQVTYELTPDNDFRISLEARTTKPTIINLSNLCYFNLGGHYGGPEQLYKHSVVINANCYTLVDEEDGLTGEIMNVVNTKFDFTTPKLMGSCLGVTPDDGFDQNLCVNRGTGQKNCFVARAVHVENGRVLEVYSNQYGVRLDTVNSWGSGILPPPSFTDVKSAPSTEVGLFMVLNDLYNAMQEIEEYDEKTFKDVYNLLKRFYCIQSTLQPNVYIMDGFMPSMTFSNADVTISGFLTSLVSSVNKVALYHMSNVDNITEWSELKMVVNDLLDKFMELDAVENWEDSIVDEEEQMTDFESVPEKLPSEKKISEKSRESVLKFLLNQTSQEKPSSSRNIQTNAGNVGDDSKPSVKLIGRGQLNSKTSRSVEIMICEMTEHSKNVVPSFYKDGRIHGKNNAIYKRHGAIAFQTQNYPDAINKPAFPSPILRPGQVYTHTIIYKFWVQKTGLDKLKKKPKC